MIKLLQRFKEWLVIKQSAKFAKELKRNYIGIELAKKYIDISKERLRQESLDMF